MDMKQLREKAKLSRVDVAYHLQVAESTVRNWEYGRTIPTLSPDQFLKLTQIYQCTIEDISEASKTSRGVSE